MENGVGQPGNVVGKLRGTWDDNVVGKIKTWEMLEKEKKLWKRGKIKTVGNI